nr:complement decay-accelerating factor isoform X3 [Kogia breviceps]
MSPARRSARVVLRLLGGLALPLLLLLRPPAASGDCSLPPDVPNAQPALGALTSFPKQSTVTYKCNEGFVKVPGKADTVVCLNNQWSEVAEFCNRSCDVPTRLLFASLKKSYTKQNYFPEGSTVEYDCRLGFIRDHSLSGKLTCLQNFTWSKPDEFCKKKSCGNPREIKNGHVSITRDLLFGSSIHFSCNTGYKLVGATSSYCSLAGNTVEWSGRFPECQEILCPEPPEVDHGMIENEQSSYAYRQSVTYKCMKGFTLHGESSIYCTVKDDQGEWSGPPPECKATRSPAVPRTTTHFHATSTPKGGGSSPSVASIIASGHICMTLTVLLMVLVTTGLLSQRRVEKKVHMSTQNISSFVELSGGVDTVYVVVFFVLRVILSLRCIRMSTKQGKMNLSWNHILSTLKTLENRRTYKIESDYFHKSVGKWRDLLILRM